MSLKEKIIQSFSKASKTYDEYATIQKTIGDKLWDLCPPLPQITTPEAPTKSIDIGCGTGYLSQKIIQKYPQTNLTLCDISQDMLDICKKNIKNNALTFLCQDAENLQDIDQEYDLIVSNMTFKWFLDLKNSLEQFQKMLTPNGYLLFSTLMGQSFFEWYDSLRQADIHIEVPLKNHILPQNLSYQIVEKFEIVQEFASPKDFLTMLKSIGAIGNKNNHKLVTKQTLQKACDIFTTQYQNKITYDVRLVLMKATETS